MTRNKKLLLMLMYICLAVFIFIGFMVVTFTYQEYRLKGEIAALEKLDITKDRFNTKIVTIGEYAVVEKSIKEYLDKYATSLQDINKIVGDDTFSKLLSMDNLASEDEFKSSIELVNKNKEQFNKDIDNLITMCDKNNIMENIKSKKLSKYYNDLYKDLMFRDDVSSKLSLSVNTLKEYKDNMNAKYDACLNIFNYLNENRGDNWKLENGEIQFANQDMVNKYNEYIEIIKK